MTDSKRFGKNIKGEGVSHKKYYNKKAVICGIVIKTAALLSTMYGIFTSSSKMKFTFFTYLSNAALAFVLFAFLVFDAVRLKTKGKCDLRSNKLYVLKYMLTISITLTFLVYMLLLGPNCKGGLKGSYMKNHGGSFCLHFLTPMLAILDFALFDFEFKSDKRHVYFALLLPLSYVLFVVVAAAHGMRWYENMSAPYNFLNFGAKTGWLGFDLSTAGFESLGIGVAYMILLLMLIFSGIGTGYLKLKDKRRKYIYGSEE